MEFDGALIKEQGVSFAIIVVRSNVLDFANQREETRQRFSKYFSGLPIVLMAQNGRGTPTYHGRQDIVRFLVNIHPSKIPWKTFTVN